MFTLLSRAAAEEALPEVTPAVEAVAEAEPGWFAVRELFDRIPG